MKKIIFGAVLSTFLLLSVQFIAPIQVKAAETEENLGNFAQQLKADSDLQTLLADTNIQNLANNVINSETEQDLRDNAEAYIDAIQATQAFTNMFGKEAYNNSITQLYDKMSNIAHSLDKKVVGSGDYYRIEFDEDNVLTITQQDDEEVTGDAVLMDREGNIKTSEDGWLAIGNWSLSFLVIVFLAVAGVGGIFYVVFSVILGIIGIIQNIFQALQDNTLVAVIISVVASAVIAIVESILDELGVEDVLTTYFGKTVKSKAKSTKRSVRLQSRLRVVNEKMQQFINSILELFNIQPKTCFA
jgi:hypothetical protein